MFQSPAHTVAVHHTRDFVVLLFTFTQNSVKTRTLPVTRARPLEPAPWASKGPNTRPESPVQTPPSAPVSFPLGSLQFFPSKGPQLEQHQSIRQVLVQVSQKRKRVHIRVWFPLLPEVSLVPCAHNQQCILRDTSSDNFVRPPISCHSSP